MGISDLLKKAKGAINVGKNKEEQEDGGQAAKSSKGTISESLKNVDTAKLSFKEKMALKMFQKMPQKKQEDILRQAMNPQEIQKNKDKILAQINEMVKSGQIDKGQAEAVKSRMGLR